MEEQYFTNFVAESRPNLMQWAKYNRRVRPEDAEDFVQEVLLRAWQGREGFRGLGKVPMIAWVKGIGRFVRCDRYYREQTQFLMQKTELLPSEEPSHDPTARLNTQLAAERIVARVRPHLSQAQVIALDKVLRPGPGQQLTHSEMCNFDHAVDKMRRLVAHPLAA